MSRVELAHCPDTSRADWLVRSRVPWAQLVTLGPEGFAAYARLRFLPDPTHVGQAEADVELPEDAPSELVRVQRVLGHLRDFTATPQNCFFCIWEGYGDAFVPPGTLSGPLVTLPHRRYVLLRGPLGAIDTWDQELGYSGASFPPAFVWPADQRWCLARDVDPHWAGIGAEREAIDRLIADPMLDVVSAIPTDVVPAYR